MNKRPIVFGVTALAVVFPVLAVASPVEIPNAFEDGAPIIAAEFNENFDAIAEAINDNDARIAALEAAVNEGAVPSGTVAFFAALDENTGGCPLGWEEVEEARGRAVVGVPSTAGALLGTVGNALTDLQNPAHSHSVSIEDDSGTSTVPHTHGVPAGTNTSTDGEHSHQWWDAGLSWTSSGALTPIIGTSATVGAGVVVSSIQSADLYTSEHAGHTHPIPAHNTGQPTNNPTHSHPIDITASTSTASTSSIIPYVQLLACVKQ